MTKIAILIAMLTVAVSATVCAPEFFGRNRFLEGFITFELLNILAVILTVTLASIANIHLSLNRIIRTAFRDKAKGMERARLVRREINQNGWGLVGLFVLSCCLLFLKGVPAIADNVYILSLVHAMGVVVLLTNLLVLCDIYQVIYAIVRLEGRTLKGRPDSSDSQSVDC